MKKIISVLSFLFILFSCTTNKVAGRESFNVISVEEEIKMGNDAYREILAQEKISTNPKDIQRLKAVSTRLIAVVGPDIPEAQWEFNAIESDQINAFALPGGKVAIYTSLLRKLNDDELAYVLGHEIAHVTCHHGSERMSQQLLVQLGAAAASVLLKGKSEKTANVFLSAYGLGAQVGVLLPFSRKNELEADKIGTRYAARSGYNPKASITTLKKFEQLFGKQQQVPEFLSTHPLDDSRIEALEKNMPEFDEAYRNARKF